MLVNSSTLPLPARPSTSAGWPLENEASTALSFLRVELSEPRHTKNRALRRSILRLKSGWSPRWLPMVKVRCFEGSPWGLVSEMGMKDHWL